jgi:hypothetical protein
LAGAFFIRCALAVHLFQFLFQPAFDFRFDSFRYLKNIDIYCVFATKSWAFTLSSISWSVNFLLSLKRSRMIPNPLSLRLPVLGYGAALVVWNAPDLRGTRDGPAALVKPEAALLGAIEARGRFATGGAIVSAANLGGAGLGAEKCSLGAG